MTEPAPSPNSPLPWQIDTARGGTPKIIAADGTPVVWHSYRSDEGIQNRADAALIILAVNAHAALAAEHDEAQRKLALAEALGVFWREKAEAAESARDAALAEVAKLAKSLESLCAWLLHRFGPDSAEGEEAGFRLRLARAALAPKGARDV